MCPRYPGISLPSAECVISCTIDGYTPCPSIAGSAVQVAPSMSGFTWLYSGQRVDRGHQRAERLARRGAGRAAGRPPARTTSRRCPTSARRTTVGGVATTVTAIVHSGGSTVEPAGSPHGSCPDVICCCTSGSAAGTSASSSADVTNRPGAVVASNIGVRPGRSTETDGDCVVGASVGSGDGDGAGRRRLGLHRRPRLRDERGDQGDREDGDEQPPPADARPPGGRVPGRAAAYCRTRPLLSARRRPRCSGRSPEAKPRRSSCAGMKFSEASRRGGAAPRWRSP